jgi:hypothetical protein
MKKIMMVLSIVAVMMIAMPAVSNAAISVEVAAIATGVEDHAPVGVAESFPYNIEKVYCYTKIIGGEAGDYVEHRWYFKDTLMATVPLTLGGPNWRTHSSKRIIRIWEGDWRVEIVHAGEAIKTLNFTITPPVEPYSTEGSSEE